MLECCDYYKNVSIFFVFISAYRISILSLMLLDFLKICFCFTGDTSVDTFQDVAIQVVFEEKTILHLLLAYVFSL